MARLLGSSLVPALLVLGACASYDPAPEELLARFPATAQDAGAPAFERRTALVQLDSAQLSGVFRAVRIAKNGAEPSVRFQLLPDLGGKVLDVSATPAFVRGYVPQSGEKVDYARDGRGSLPRNALLFLAISLLEEAAPLTVERVRGARREGLDWELLLVPVLSGTRVSAVVTESGELLERRYFVRGIRWIERLASTRALEGEGFLMRFEDVRVEPLEDVEPDVFALSLTRAGADG